MCERCLKAFPFPQGDTRKQWKYRVTGPFSVPNFSEGAYCVVLTLNMFSHKLSGPSHGAMTYTTGLNLKHEQFDRGVDFAFWHSESVTLGQRTEPRFVFGEAKSFAEEAVTDRDIDTLKRVADAVPGSIVVVSVLKPGFGNNEKTRLAEFTKWGWKLIHGRPRAQVRMGRPAYWIRRPGASHWRQVLHRQLPVRRWWTEGTQQARRHRPLRESCS